MMNDNKAYLYERLIKLGDLISDGCHLESDGKWIENEYKQTMRLLGIKSPVKKKRQYAPSQIDEFMKKRCIDVACECGGELRQTRKGAFTAKCTNCGRKYKLGKRIRY